jgi:hypothetical protein
MPTVAYFQKRARELTALAEREPEHKAQCLIDAAAWLLLAKARGGNGEAGCPQIRLDPTG